VSVSVGKVLLETTSFRLIGQIISWASTVIVMRLLLPEDYAIISLVSSVYALSIVFVDWSITPMLVRQAQIKVSTEQSVFNYSMSIAILACCGLLAISTIADTFILQGTKQAFWVQAVTVLLIPFRVIPEARMAREQRFRIQNAAIFIEIISIALASLVLALYLRSYLAISFGVLIGVTLRSAFSTYHGGHGFGRRPSWACLKDVFKQTKLIAIADLLQQLAALIPIYVMGVFLGGHSLGLTLRLFT
jgi:O-antigen/teichoic acid export membrane protein